MVVLDIGAYIGYYTLIAAKQVGPRGKVYALEPDPISYSFLNQNIQLNRYSNVITFPKAASNHMGAAKFYLNSADASKTSLLPRDGWEKAISIECITLDEIIGDQRIDVAKIDVEGAEPMVLEGMKKTIEGNPQLILFIEQNPVALWEGGSSPDALETLLKDLGYKIIVRIDEEWDSQREVVFCNLYCRRS